MAVRYTDEAESAARDHLRRLIGWRVRVRLARGGEFDAHVACVHQPAVSDRWLVRVQPVWQDGRPLGRAFDLDPYEDVASLDVY